MKGNPNECEMYIVAVLERLAAIGRRLLALRDEPGATTVGEAQLAQKVGDNNPGPTSPTTVSNHTQNGKYK